MNRRLLATILLAAFAVPATAAAQNGALYREPGMRPRLSVAPFAGYLTPFTRGEEWGFDNGTTTVHTDAQFEVGGGAVAGLSVEVPIIGALGVVAASAWGRRGDTNVSVQQGVDSFRLDGNDLLLGRLGLSLRLRQDASDIVVRRVGAAIFGGGVLLRERPRPEPGSPDFQEEATHYGVNFGLVVDIPVYRNRVSLQVAAEDNLMFWNEDALASVPYEYFDQQGTSRDQTSVIVGRTHAFLLRAGLSIHFW
jgi:hypothetical protein